MSTDQSKIPGDVLAEAYRVVTEAAEQMGISDPDGAAAPIVDTVAPLIFAAGVQAGREAEPVPCQLDHGCQSQQTCDCWCELHDCRLDECPSYRLIASWIKDATQAGREAAAADIEEYPGPDPSPASDMWWAGYSEAQRDAARIARGTHASGIAIDGEMSKALCADDIHEADATCCRIARADHQGD